VQVFDPNESPSGWRPYLKPFMRNLDMSDTEGKQEPDTREVMTFTTHGTNHAGMS
jgi:hypothetical protein